MSARTTVPSDSSSAPRGLAASRRVKVKDLTLVQLPRRTQRDPAVYAVTLKDDVPEGKLLNVDVGLALGDEGTTLWTGRLSTRTPFRIEEVRCGSAQAP